MQHNLPIHQPGRKLCVVQVVRSESLLNVEEGSDSRARNEWLPNLQDVAPFTDRHLKMPMPERVPRTPRRLTSNLLWTLLGLAVSIFVGACSPPPPPPPSAYLPGVKIKVVTTTQQLAELARAVGGEAVDVECILAPGKNPHLWRPNANDIVKFRSADLVLINGLGLEKSLLGMKPDGQPTVEEDLTKLNSTKNMVAIAVTDQLAESDLILSNGRPDPHVWMSPTLWCKCVDRVTSILSSMVVAEARPFFEARGHETKYTLNNTANWARRLIEKIEPQKRHLLAANDTLAYLAREFQIDYRAIAGPADKELAASPELADWIAGHKPKFLLAESDVFVAHLQPAKMKLGLTDATHNFIHSLTLAPPGTTQLAPLGGDLDISTSDGNFRLIIQMVAKWSD